MAKRRELHRKFLETLNLHATYCTRHKKRYAQGTGTDVLIYPKF